MSKNQMPPEYRAYQKRLERLAAGTFPRVVADTINTVAGFAHIQSIRNVRERMVLRNAYTERSIRYYKANPKADATKINAVTGSVQPYMALQEKGGYRRPKRGRKAPVATLEARGGSKTRVVRKRFHAGQLGKKQFIGKGHKGSRPTAVWERRSGNKEIKMIRNLGDEKIPVKTRSWHTDAVKKYSSKKDMSNIFMRLAKEALAKDKK